MDFIFILWFISLVFLLTVCPGIPFYIIFLKAIAHKQKTLKLNSPEKFPLISFIIPVFNEETVIEQKLKNTFELAYPGQLEVIVIDDGSTDSTPDILKRWQIADRRLVYVRNKRLGKAAALRTGIKTAKGEIIALSDADSILNNEALFNSAKELIMNPKTGCVSAVIASKDKDTNAFHRMGEYMRVLESRIRTASHPAGPFSCIRKNLIDDFTESSSTDLDTGLRVIKQGYRVKVLDTVRAQGSSPPTFTKEYVKHVIRPFAGRVHGLRKYRSLIFRRKQNPFESFILLRYLFLVLLEPFAFFTLLITSFWLLIQIVSSSIIIGEVWLIIAIIFIIIDLLSKNLISKVIVRRAFFYGLEILGIIRYVVKGPYIKWQMKQRD